MYEVVVLLSSLSFSVGRGEPASGPRVDLAKYHVLNQEFLKLYAVLSSSKVS